MGYVTQIIWGCKTFRNENSRRYKIYVYQNILQHNYIIKFARDTKLGSYLFPELVVIQIKYNKKQSLAMSNYLGS